MGLVAERMAHSVPDVRLQGSHPSPLLRPSFHQESRHVGITDSIHSYIPLLNTDWMPGALLLGSWRVAGGHGQALLPVSFL